jgi:hypothetical protein
MTLKIKIASILLPAAILLASCGGEHSTNNNPETNDTNNITTKTDTGKLDELKEFKYDLVISNIPIPFDILSTLNKTGVAYNKALLNSPASSSKYSQNNSKAINLGIFGADMAYNISFEQYTEVSSYLKSTKKLADDLGIPIAFDQQALAKYAQFKNNKDSLEKIIFASYNEVDKTLKSNERIGLATLVVTGGWIEGLYATCKTIGTTAKDEKNKMLFDKIAEQRYHLNQLIGLLAEFNSDAFFTSLIADLNDLKTAFDAFANKVTTTEAEVKMITEKVDALRTKIVNG